MMTHKQDEFVDEEKQQQTQRMMRRCLFRLPDIKPVRTLYMRFIWRSFCKDNIYGQRKVDLWQIHMGNVRPDKIDVKPGETKQEERASYCYFSSRCFLLCNLAVKTFG